MELRSKVAQASKYDVKDFECALKFSVRGREAGAVMDARVGWDDGTKEERGKERELRREGARGGYDDGVIVEVVVLSCEAGGKDEGGRGGLSGVWPPASWGVEGEAELILSIKLRRTR